MEEMDIFNTPKEKNGTGMQIVSIGKQRFDSIRENNYFYVDKTTFIKEWWEAGDDVTLITRPRHFGKTLNMNMLECFFSIATRREQICLKDWIYGKKTPGNLSSDFCKLCRCKTEKV